MIYRFWIVLVIIFFTSLSIAQPKIIVKPGFVKYFEEHNVYGSILIYSEKDSCFITNNPGRSDSSFLPASTFKIPNSLIALETGVIKDTNEVIKWDSTHYNIESWNRNHTLRSAFANSVVWFYQEVARRIGEKRMQHFVDTMNYGNRDISGGIDRFWLDGSLRISQSQQIDFLRRMYYYQLPVSRRSIDIVKNIMILEQTPAAILHAKTGFAIRDLKNIGWLVGYVERGKDIYFFATCIERNSPDDLFGKARLEITKKVFAELEIFP